MADCVLSALSQGSVLCTLRGDGAGGVSFRGEGIGSSFILWEFPHSPTADDPSGEKLSCPGMEETILWANIVSVGGIMVGLMFCLEGKSPIGRSGIGGRSVMTARTVRLVSNRK